MIVPRRYRGQVAASLRVALERVRDALGASGGLAAAPVQSAVSG
jgi:hypothetical protein